MYKNKQAVRTEMQRRVTAGVDWLDEHEPGWVEAIDLNQLDLGLGCSCVLGQLAIDMDLLGEGDSSDTGFSVYVDRASLTMWDAQEMGFWLPAADQERVRSEQGEVLDGYSVLTEIWTDTIHRLRSERNV